MIRSLSAMELGRVGRRRDGGRRGRRKDGVRIATLESRFENKETVSISLFFLEGRIYIITLFNPLPVLIILLNPLPVLAQAAQKLFVIYIHDSMRFVLSHLRERMKMVRKSL